MKQENKDWSRDIAALYCVNKQRIVEEDCNMECQSGKCLCMDHEQLFLLQCLMETEMVININADGVMMEKKETLAATYCYKQCASVRKLINCHGYSVKNLAYKQTEKNVLGSLPVIQYVNMNDMLDARRSLACLCLFNGQGAEILKAYMKAIVKCLCGEWPDRNNVKAVGVAADRLFRQIQILYQKDDHKITVQKLEQNFEQFSDAYCDHCLHNLAETIRESDYYLQEKEDRYDEFPNALSWILSDEPDMRDGLYYLYHIAEMILTASEGKIGAAMRGFFGKDQSERLEHDTYENVGECVKRLLMAENAVERYVLCREINELFDNEL